MKQLAAEIQRSLQAIYTTDEAKALTRCILTRGLGFQEMDYFLKPPVTLTADQHTFLSGSLQRLLQYEPLQYILGEADFCGLTFQVDPDVLIPRPETAELVQWILQKSRPTDRILDIGTGSGCIAITLSKSVPQAEVWAWDVSEPALRTARSNNLRHHTAVQFRRQDILLPPPAQPVQPFFDIIVSNPPYITECERVDMQPNVSRWEPETALFVPDNEPLLFYRSVAQWGEKLLRPAGQLYFEINRSYGKQVCDLLLNFGYCNVTLRQDMYGNDRMVKAEKA